MGVKALWPTVAIVTVLAAMITVLFMAGVDPIAVLALVSFLVTNVITLMLYGKLQQVETNVQRVESNTNGMTTAQLEMLKDLLEHVKKSPPVES
jgi:hypothetical protein